ncbi:MAG: hypothetical protein D3909_08580, partial [Candidatus Electrothrix sp. ATG1]|nr:hypothetical protein [Candidatus Electrothrix sp. ATG1]
LQLQRKPEQPDQVHLIFELAKQLTQHKVSEDTFVKAGKDSSEKNLFYATDEELIVTKAWIDETHGLKTIFVEKEVVKKENDSASEGTEEIKGIYAAPVANSDDGEGKVAIQNQEGKWETFGNADMPGARVGFAVASPMFLLTEGVRTITLHLYMDDLPEPLKEIPDEAAGGQKGFSVEDASGDELAKGIKKINGAALANAVKRRKKTELADFYKEHRNILEKISGNGLIGAINHVNKEKFIDIQKDTDGNDLIDTLAELNKEVFTGAVDRIREKMPLDQLNVAASGEKEWIPLTIESITRGKEGKKDYLSFILKLNPEHPPVVNYNEKVLAQGLNVNDPVVKFEFRPSEKNSAQHLYSSFKDVKISRLGIDVNVKGVKDLILENDLGVLNPSKPFLPFGPVPKKGSKFYVGSNEVFKKPLKSVKLTIYWGDLPVESFTAHYNKYTGYSILNTSFTTNISLRYKGKWIGPADNEYHSQKLFNNHSDENIAPENPSIFDFNRQDKQQLDFPDRFTPFTQFSNTLQYGFLRFDLQHSFLHSLYPTFLAKAITKGDETNVPNQPYTPLITEISLDYHATYTTTLNEDCLPEKARLFQITPFGHREFSSENPYLLDRFPVAGIGTEPAKELEDTISAGTLYIGIKDLHPPQNLSILFQVAEGSAAPEAKEEKVYWSYLADNRWTAFKDTEILSDKTNGLLTSGIIKFSIPQEISSKNTLLPSGLHWIKASVQQHPDAVCKLIAVIPQAVVAGFRNDENDLAHLETALPADTISKLKNRSSGIKKVMQPYASFG